MHARQVGRQASSSATFRFVPHRLGDLFGVGGFLTQRNGAVDRLLMGRLKLLGTQWVREEFTASRLHHGTNAPYFWRPYDHIVDEERRIGLHVLGLLDYSNTWEYGNHATMPPAHMRRLSADFARYAYAVARHFRGRVDFWQVWNEPDLPTFWHPAPSADGYALLLRDAYRAIKRANRHARVVLAGTSRIDLQFLRRVVTRTHSFDVISVHPYRNVPEPGLLTEIRGLQSFRKPIWFSEIGWAAGGCDLCTGEDTQASFLVRSYALAAAARVERVFWYDLRDDNSDPSSPEAHFGLLRGDLSGKPAFVAYEFLTRLLRRASFAGAEGAGRGGVYALQFQSALGPVAILWNVAGSTRSVGVSWPASRALALATDGTVLGEAEIRNHRAWWRLPPDGQPVYLAERAPAARVFPPRALLHPPPPPPDRRSSSPARTRKPPRRAPPRTGFRRRPPNRGAWAVPTARPRPARRPGRRKPPAERRLPTPTPTVTEQVGTPFSVPTSDPASPTPTTPSFVQPVPSVTPEAPSTRRARI